MCTGILLFSAIVVFTDNFKDAIHNFFWYNAMNNPVYPGVQEPSVAVEGALEAADEAAVDEGFLFYEETVDAVRS